MKKSKSDKEKLKEFIKRLKELKKLAGTLPKLTTEDLRDETEREFK